MTLGDVLKMVHDAQKEQTYEKTIYYKSSSQSVWCGYGEVERDQHIILWLKPTKDLESDKLCKEIASQKLALKKQEEILDALILETLICKE